MNFLPRTDLAMEGREFLQKTSKQKSEISGVSATFDTKTPNIAVTNVKILSKSGSIALCKPIGEYITLESPIFNNSNDEFDQAVISKIAENIKALSKINENDSVLVVGLGNKQATPDALGPKTVEKLAITRHLVKYSPELLNKNIRSVSAIIPGVLGTTGIETYDIIKSIVQKTKPSLVIVVDALASSDAKRVSTTIQITDSGITPGSGVKNNRQELSKKNLGVPVIAIGAPTVVSIHALTHNILENAKISQKDTDTVIEYLKNDALNFIVTPNTIDAIIENLSTLIAEGINVALLR